MFNRFISFGGFFIIIFLFCVFCTIYSSYSNFTEFHFDILNSSEFIWPLPGYGKNNITSDFGFRISPTYGGSIYHEGIDIGVPERYSNYCHNFWNCYFC